MSYLKDHLLRGLKIDRFIPPESSDLLSTRRQSHLTIRDVT
jgi:hypothetical protein